MGESWVARLDDPRIAGYRDLKDGLLRLQRGEFVVEGRGNLRCLIERSPYQPLSLLLSESARDAVAGSLAGLDPATPVYLCAQALLREIVGYDVHRGCLALCRRVPERSLEELLQARSPRDARSLVVVLEGLGDHQNVGGVFRNAQAFGADFALLCPRCSDPLYRKAIRVSMGATLCLPFARGAGWPQKPLALLRRAGYRVIGLDPGGEPQQRLRPGTAPGPLALRTALVLGAEGEGLSEALRAGVDQRLRIEMAPGIDSLNVATASGIALHHFFAQQLAAHPGSGASDEI